MGGEGGGDRWEARARAILCPLCARGVPLADATLLGRRAHVTAESGGWTGAAARGYEDGALAHVGGVSSAMIAGPDLARELRAAFEAGRT